MLTTLQKGKENCLIKIIKVEGERDKGKEVIVRDNTALHEIEEGKHGVDMKNL